MGVRACIRLLCKPRRFRLILCPGPLELPQPLATNSEAAPEAPMAASDDTPCLTSRSPCCRLPNPKSSPTPGASPADPPQAPHPKAPSAEQRQHRAEGARPRAARRPDRLVGGGRCARRRATPPLPPSRLRYSARRLLQDGRFYHADQIDKPVRTCANDSRA